MLPGPREKFSETEINYMKKYLESGGSIFVLLGEGGEKRFGTNINFLLEEYGIMVNNDAVVRTNYYKYFHPKECLIQVTPDWMIPAHVTASNHLFQNGVLNRAVSEAAGKTVPGLSLDEGKEQGVLNQLFTYVPCVQVWTPSLSRSCTRTAPP